MIPFYKYQFGFRESHSTQHAIITLVDKITSSLDSGDLIIGVFLDLKKHLTLQTTTYYTDSSRGRVATRQA